MEINRQRLLVAIGRVLPGVSKKELFDGADKLAFTEDGHLVSYNDEVSIFERLPEAEGITGAVDGRKLHELLDKLKSDLVELTAVGDKLRVKSTRATASFDLTPVALPIDEIDRSGDGIPLPEGFVQALKLVAESCARDMSRPVLTCVSFRPELDRGVGRLPHGETHVPRRRPARGAAAGRRGRGDRGLHRRERGVRGRGQGMDALRDGGRCGPRSSPGWCPVPSRSCRRCTR